MIKWHRIEAGEYVGENERFRILKTWDRIYGNHWMLRDAEALDIYKGTYHERTLLECKLKAEGVLHTQATKEERKDDCCGNTEA